MQVERVDFASIASQDIERSRRFYLETLGLPLDHETPAGPNPNDVAAARVFHDPHGNALMLHRRYAP